MSHVDNSLNPSEKITRIIIEEKLKREQNYFSIRAKNCHRVDVSSALNIAYNYREVTKNFVLTSIKGLACLVDKITEKGEPNDNQLHVLQTVFSVMSDDINNAHPVFKKVAPQGIHGVHYKWWENSILSKLTKLTDVNPLLFNGTKHLVDKMKAYALNPMGTAIQLRVVESIALDVVTALYTVFNKVEYNGEKVFQDEKDMLWFTLHMQAEVVHNAQVCDETSGMTKIAQTSQEEVEMLENVSAYCKAWALALDDFATALK